MSKIAFLGAGNMAAAFAEGLLARAAPAHADLICYSASGRTAAALAAKTGKGFILIGKYGELASKIFSRSYGLEYGKDTLEIHQDACSVGNSVLIVDDVLATGGTACAAIKLIEKTGAKVAGLVFLLEIGFLNGRSRILDEFADIDIRSLKII